MDNEAQQKEETPILERPTYIIIPECCRNNWPSCTHVARKHRKVKTNIGL